MNHATPGGDEQQRPAETPQAPERQEPGSQPSVGAQLAAQREMRKWTVEQVASQLNLAPRQIQALEQDNFDALPGMASVRGFIRAYAKLLKMDAAPLIAMLTTESAAPPIEPLHSRRPLAPPFSDAKYLPSAGKGAAPAKPILLAVAILLLLAGATVAYHFGWLQMPTLSDVAPDHSPAASADAEPATSAAPAQETNAAAGTQAAPAADAPPVVSGAGAPVAEAATPAAATAAPAAADGKNAFVLTMREESWLEIRRLGEAAPGTSNVLLSRLEKAGSVETFEVTEPVVVTIGNVGGVEATFRGQPLDLKAGAKSNVVRLTLK